ncbi:M56 family metallopeptidase [Henriciella sp.]|uniref:M56 family metallopeptidase n=1 Tax=Henriciella sp. TaxID=1968823 RepID=UPI00262D1013|nr:M56 family metallopeptidase [Henriciella sp.]
MIALADIWIAVLCGIAVAIVASLALAVAAPLMLRPLRRVAPGLRVAILIGMLSAPLLSGAVVAILVAFSTHAWPLDLVTHHCHIDSAACASHARADDTLLLTALGAGSLCAILLWFGLSFFGLISRSNQSQRLLRLASVSRLADAHVVQTPKPVALSAGLLRSETFVSDGLVRALDSKQLAVVMAHEEAHARRRDGLFRLMGHLLSIGHLPWTQRLLMHELELAQEQACDALAAIAHGAIRTAETLLAVERLKQAFGYKVPDACMAFGDADIELRAHALLAPRFFATGWSAAGFVLTMLASALSLFIVSEPIHHELESIFLSNHH